MPVSTYILDDEFNGDFSKVCIPGIHDVIEFCWNFNRPLSNVKFTPNCVTHMVFNRDYEQRITELPPTVTRVLFRGQYNYPFDKAFDNVRLLWLGFTKPYKTFNFTKLPPNLVYLYINVDTDAKIQLDVMPKLKNFTLRSKHDNGILEKLDIIFPNLQSLTLYGKTNEQIRLPHTIKNVTFDDICSKDIIFPISIQSYVMLSYTHLDFEFILLYPTVAYYLLKYVELIPSSNQLYVEQRCKINMHNRNKRRTDLSDDLL